MKRDNLSSEEGSSIVVLGNDAIVDRTPSDDDEARLEDDRTDFSDLLQTLENTRLSVEATLTASLDKMNQECENEMATLEKKKRRSRAKLDSIVPFQDLLSPKFIKKLHLAEKLYDSLPTASPDTIVCLGPSSFVCYFGFLRKTEYVYTNSSSSSGCRLTCSGDGFSSECRMKVKLIVMGK